MIQIVTRLLVYSSFRCYLQGWVRTFSQFFTQAKEVSVRGGEHQNSGEDNGLKKLLR